jgi:hypothetical protein
MDRINDSAKGKRDTHFSLKQPENLGGCPNDDVWPIRKQDSSTRSSYSALYQGSDENLKCGKRTVAAVT